jgi:hypothetical protein
MIQRQPETARVMEKQQRKDHRKRDPQGELLMNRQRGKGIQEKETRHRDPHGGRVIDIDGADEVALLFLELEAAVKTMAVHGKRAAIQRTEITTRALEAKRRAQHR